MPASAASLARVDTEFSADSIEFCPHLGFDDVFVCGTYQVLEPTTVEAADRAPSDDEEVSDEPKKQTQRTGRLLLFRVQDDQRGMHEIQRIDTAAILDTKWAPTLDSAGRPVLAVGDAKGHITLYTLDPALRRLEPKQQLQVAEETTLCLSLDFEPRAPHRLIISLSSGHLALLTPDSGGLYEISDTWKAHDYEPWITAWDRWTEDTVWSGGDDCKLKRWNVQETSMPTFVNKRFDAGVTTIASSPHTAHLLAVGSYDENLRLYDTRQPGRALRTIPVGGGIWRTKFHPSLQRRGDVLLACMHNGFTTVRLAAELIDDTTEKQAMQDHADCETVTCFEAHESLAYGVDWSRLAPHAADEGSLVVSCSFYDHTMHMWRS